MRTGYGAIRTHSIIVIRRRLIINVFLISRHSDDHDDILMIMMI